MCILFIHKSPVLAISALTELWSAEAKPAAAKRIHNLNSQRHQQEKEKGAKKSIAMLLVNASCKWYVFSYRDFDPCLGIKIRLSPVPTEKTPIMVLRSAFSSSSTVTSMTHSLPDAERFRLKLVADKRSSSKAACLGNRKVGR